MGFRAEAGRLRGRRWARAAPGRCRRVGCKRTCKRTRAGGAAAAAALRPPITLAPVPPRPPPSSPTPAGGALQDMALFKYSRLSVQPVTAQQWEFVLGLEGQGE